MALVAMSEDRARTQALREAQQWKTRALQAEQTILNLRADLGDVNALITRLAAALTHRSTTGQGMSDLLFVFDAFTQPIEDADDDLLRRQARFAETGTTLAILIEELDGLTE